MVMIKKPYSQLVDMMKIINIYERALFQIEHQNAAFIMKDKINFRNAFDTLKHQIDKEDMQEITSIAMRDAEEIIEKCHKLKD